MDGLARQYEFHQLPAPGLPHALCASRRLAGPRCGDRLEAAGTSYLNEGGPSEGRFGARFRNSKLCPLDNHTSANSARLRIAQTFQPECVLLADLTVRRRPKRRERPPGSS